MITDLPLFLWVQSANKAAAMRSALVAADASGQGYVADEELAAGLAAAGVKCTHHQVRLPSQHNQHPCLCRILHGLPLVPYIAVRAIITKTAGQCACDMHRQKMVQRDGQAAVLMDARQWCCGLAGLKRKWHGGQAATLRHGRTLFMPGLGGACTSVAICRRQVAQFIASTAAAVQYLQPPLSTPALCCCCSVTCLCVNVCHTPGRL